MGSLIPKAEYGVLIPKEISACFQMEDSVFYAPKKSAVTMVVKWVVFLGSYIQKLRRGGVSQHPIPPPPPLDLPLGLMHACVKENTCLYVLTGPDDPFSVN